MFPEGLFSLNFSRLIYLLIAHEPFLLDFLAILLFRFFFNINLQTSSRSIDHFPVPLHTQKKMAGKKWLFSLKKMAFNLYTLIYIVIHFRMFYFVWLLYLHVFHQYSTKMDLSYVPMTNKTTLLRVTLQVFMVVRYLFFNTYLRLFYLKTQLLL